MKSLPCSLYVEVHIAGHGILYIMPGRTKRRYMTEYDIYKKVKYYIEENHMLVPHAHVLIGLSGGADSMAMTDLLLRYREERQELPFMLQAVHVHHGIRGAEADRDERVVREFCQRRELPYRSFFYDIPGYAREHGIGTEEAGRQCRQQAFAQVIAEEETLQSGPFLIALAHNKNDLAETMLHHLARGTGLHGLTGIHPTAEGRIRPLLCLERREIELYCQERGLTYVTDSSNLGDAYTRNRIRHYVIPLLEQEVNSAALTHLAETAVQISQADQLLHELALELLHSQIRTETGYLLEQDFFHKAEILQSYAVLEALKEISGRGRDFSSVHIREILALYGKQVARSVSLPEQMWAVRRYEGVLLERKVGSEARPDDFYRLPIGRDGQYRTMYGSFTIRRFPYSGQEIPQKKYTKWFDYDKITSELLVRTRREGDELILDRQGRHKKLKRYFIDEKVPAEERDQIPLLACGKEILWVIGGRISEKYKVTTETSQNTNMILEIQFEGGKNHERKN